MTAMHMGWWYRGGKRTTCVSVHVCECVCTDMCMCMCLCVYACWVCVHEQCACPTVCLSVCTCTHVCVCKMTAVHNT